MSQGSLASLLRTAEFQGGGRVYKQFGWVSPLLKLPLFFLQRLPTLLCGMNLLTLTLSLFLSSPSVDDHFLIRLIDSNFLTYASWDRLIT